MIMQPFRVPALPPPSVSVRLAQDAQAVDAANQLVLRKYAEQDYWSGDEHKLDHHHHLHRASRLTFVVADDNRILGTVSIIVDSPCGIPADAFRREAVDRLRAGGEKIAEISAFAFDRGDLDQLSLIHLLGAFVFQYSLYHADIDYLVAVCTPRHARFHALYYGMQLEGPSSIYGCIDIAAQMLTLSLREGHRQALMTPRSDRSCAFRRFLYLDEHAAFRFPDGATSSRPRGGGATLRCYRADSQTSSARPADAAAAHLSGVGG
jgi:uncharacterized protein YqiB (DUF1249 family)